MTVQIEPETRSVLMADVSWDYYSRTLEELGPSRATRITFDKGMMEIRKTSPLHQRKKHVIARLLETYAVEADIPLDAFGTLTLRRKDKHVGLEPDDCYYLQTPSPPLQDAELDFRFCPMPDLAIDVGLSCGAIARMPIYRALKVPEIWEYSASGVTPLLRTAAGNYKRSITSAACPHLDMLRFNRFVAGAIEDEHRSIKALQAWARQPAKGRVK